ncbi:MAG: hypothetical protein IPO40_10680 [Fibrobacteres bacterium]|nr:hypothetical protein [Fibrobacterota bacterium]
MESFRTVILERIEILKLLDPIQSHIQTFWGDTIKVSHGGVTDVAEEKYHVWWNILAVNMKSTIMEQEINESYILGQCDFFISNLDETESIHLCHEADVHFDVNSNFANEIKLVLAKEKIELELRE